MQPFSVNAAASQISLYIDGKNIVAEQPPVLIDGSTLVPMRMIFEQLGAEVTWDSATQSATAIKSKDAIALHIGETSVVKNGKPLSLEVAPRLINGHTMVPVRFVSEALGASVSWNESTRAVSVHSVVNGYGKQYFSGGQLKYEGEFREGKFHGPGKLYAADGQLLFEGPFLKGAQDKAAKILDSMPFKYQGAHATYYGDELTTPGHLQDYDRYLESTVIPAIVSIFPDVALAGLDPLRIVVLSTAESVQKRYAQLELDNAGAYGIYSPAQHLLTITEQFDPEHRVNAILIAHEFTHAVQYHGFGDFPKVPTFITEGLAHNVAWSIYDKGLDGWSSSLASDHWQSIRSSSETVPDLWDYKAQDKWTIASVHFLLKSFGAKKLSEFFKLAIAQKSEEAFQQAFGLSPAEFQKRFEDEVGRMRK